MPARMMLQLTNVDEEVFLGLAHDYLDTGEVG